MLYQSLKHVALQYGLDETAGNYIVDNFITVLPEDVKQGMILLEENPRYHKKDNVKIDFNKSLIAGAEFAASISKPESVFNYINQYCLRFLLLKGQQGRK